MPHREQRTYRCGVCGRRGHNRFTCPEIVTVASDVVYMKFSPALFDRAVARAEAMGISVDELVSRALEDESLWRAASRPRVVTPPAPIDVPPVRCGCCARGCRFVFEWRGQPRCGCTAERIRILNQQG